MFVQGKLILKGVYEEYCRSFSKLGDFQEQIKSAIEVLYEILPLDLKCQLKNSETSITFRREADNLFVQKKETACGLLILLQLYSKSVAFAENNSEALPIAYANRSVVLYYLRKYEESIRDIDRALQLHYPDSRRPNLLRRKAKCLSMLDNLEADKVCTEATKMLENIQLNDVNKIEVEETVNAATEIITRHLKNQKNRRILPDIIRGSKIPCASSAVDISYNEKSGRHVRAVRDINVGEVLVLEKPYALVLNPDHIYSHCSHCFIRAWDCIPCSNCVYAMYCSESCRDEAWKQYHDIECPIKGHFFAMEMNDLAPFSLRLAVLAIREAGSIEKLDKQLKIIDDCQDPLSKCLTDGVYRSDVYRAIYCLETHQKERLWPELLSIVFNSAIITYLVCTSTPLFSENSKNNSKLSEDHNALFLAKLIGHHYMTIQINDHGFSEVDRKGKNHNVGAVVYAFCSLFNHSCNPNVTRVPMMDPNNKPQLLMLALNPIKEGMQIFDDYGFDFAGECLESRRSLCYPYHFCCECEACTNNWPIYCELKSLQQMVGPKHRTKQLRAMIKKYLMYQKIIMEADYQSLDANSDSVILGLARIVTSLYDYGCQPNGELYESVMLFRHAFSLVYGNRLNF